MSARHDEETTPDLAAQAARRTAVPAAHGVAQPGKEQEGAHQHGHVHHYDHNHNHEPEHDHHEHDDHDGHDHEHAFEWPEMLRIGLVAVAAACVGWQVWEPFAAV